MKISWLAPAALALCLAACKEDPPPQKDAPAEATAPAVDSKLKQALTAEPAAPGAAAAPGDGPPPTGVFEPGAADKAHAVGAPPSVEVVEKGSEPRVVLRPKINLGEGRELRLLVGHSSGDPRTQQKSVLPNVVYTLRFSAPKAKEEGEGEKPASGPTPLVITIADIDLAKEQPGQVPDELKKLIGQVKGSRIETEVLPSGALGGLSIEYGSDLKEAAVRLFVDNVADAITPFFSPFPEEPIGKGGYWISHDRVGIQNLDLVRYRVTKVEELKGDEAVFSVQIRHYLAGGDIAALVRSIAGRDQPGIVAAGFESTGNAQLARNKDDLFPTKGEMRTPFVLVLAAGQNPQQGQPVELDLQARLMP